MYGVAGCSGKGRKYAPDRDHDSKCLARAETIGNPARGNLKQSVSDGKYSKNQTQHVFGNREVLHNKISGRGNTGTIHVGVDAVEKKNRNKNKSLSAHPSLRLFHNVILCLIRLNDQ